ncbi:TcmI family type II polyketide cyclase [Lentzea sp. DG1S-22]|uniref:TcmI family type II polyketide cyclase n=1 Tax=Lentzea sp. DG1S-22 TaxID=3108822 RepID=UPI002E77C769|nr:TcmI family type II polyketide cyclase [Lentzea sp. DG1S-22]WVH82278.1 TcmI family type II polyketide cyclase [Lentzea sp. DG1S-22]
MHRTLIVARMVPGAADEVAAVFADSDRRSDLPAALGVRGRSLFRFGELYLHLVESDRPLAEAMAAHRDDPRFRRISQDLSPFVTAYDPEAWREPKDAMAHEFYRWERHV